MARSVEVPFVVLSDGSKILTHTQLMEDPELMAFYNRYKKSFTTLLNMNAVRVDDPNERVWAAISEAGR